MMRKLIQKVCERFSGKHVNGKRFFRLVLYQNRNDQIRSYVRKYIVITSLGVSFTYRGDEITWRWKKYKGLRWLSAGFNSHYRTLKDIDKEWKGYEEYCRRLEYESYIGGSGPY